MKNLLALLLCGLFSVSGIATAGDHHGHSHDHEAAAEPAPHGGILRDSPPYKVELVLNGDVAKIFVYDKELKPVANERLAATITGELAFPKEEARAVSFTLGADAYEATLAGIGAVHRYDMHVKLIIDGQEILGDFGIDNIH